MYSFTRRLTSNFFHLIGVEGQSDLFITKNIIANQNMSVKHGNLIYDVSSANILSHNTLKNKQYKANYDSLYGDKESQLFNSKECHSSVPQNCSNNEICTISHPMFCKQI
ncbi:hypothetical protein H311_01665 [Anncaliia algerae PRA109]|nr:hypothetical protein H311_01665 [Anncaliia algerae PRA109]